MSFEALSEKLSALQESNAQLRIFIDRLANLKFQPGSIPLNNVEDNVMVELCEEIKQTIKDQDEDLELFQEEILDLAAGRYGSELAVLKEGLKNSAERAIQELRLCQTAYHKAFLQAKRNLEVAQAEERKLIAQSFMKPRASNNSSPIPGQQRRRMQNTTELSKDEKTINASSDVTLALRRTHDMMAAELSRSQFAHDTLKESTAALAQLGETYSTLDTMLSASRNLIGTLLRSQKSDTWYLETAFWVLVTTICWLIFRRWIYGPAWWFLWFPVRLFFRSLIGVLTGVGVIGGTAVGSAGSSLSGGATAVYDGGSREAPRASVAGEDAPSISASSGTQNSEGNNMVEEVGQIIDDSGMQLEDEQAESQRNPNKRMWEEDTGALKDKAWQKDEL